MEYSLLPGTGTPVGNGRNRIHRYPTPEPRLAPMFYREAPEDKSLEVSCEDVQKEEAKAIVEWVNTPQLPT